MLDNFFHIIYNNIGVKQKYFTRYQNEHKEF